MPAFRAFIHPWSMRIDLNFETVRLRSDSDGNIPAVSEQR